MTSRVPLTRPSRAGVLRATGVVLITALVTIAAACSNEDTVDTIPPPWPTATNRSLDAGPRVPSSTTSTTVPRSTGPGTTSSRR